MFVFLCLLPWRLLAWLGCLGRSFSGYRWRGNVMCCRLWYCLPPPIRLWRFWGLFPGLLSASARFNAWQELTPQFRWIPFPCPGQPLNGLLIQPHCRASKWDGIVIQLPEDRSGGNQLVSLNNERQQEYNLFFFCKYGSSVLMNSHMGPLIYKGPYRPQRVTKGIKNGEDEVFIRPFYIIFAPPLQPCNFVKIPSVFSAWIKSFEKFWREFFLRCSS